MHRPNHNEDTASDGREIAGWMMYDWANSTFSTTVAGALLGPYLTALAQADSRARGLGENGVVLDLGPFGALTAGSFFPLCISVSVLLQVFLLPILGSIADYTSRRKQVMAFFCYAGAAAVSLMFFVTGGRYLWGGLLFIVANLCFGASIVLYNAFLPDICPPEQRDRVSSRGFALGYLGGGILLAINLSMLMGAKALGISAELAVRLSLLSAGLWWAGFAVITFRRLRTRPAPRTLSVGRSLFTAGLFELGSTFRKLKQLPHTLQYLVGYLFYNDGISTVLSVSAIFLSQELFSAADRESGSSQMFVLGVFLMTQFVAFLGALLFERIAAAIGVKRSILISLVLWCGAVVYAYGFLQTQTQAWGMAAVIALVLGGSQALSRSLFAGMIPRGYEASFFGFYEVSERGTAWMGPAIFGIVVGATGSYRQAILSLIALFITGTVILAFTDTRRAIREAHAPLHRSAGD